jgi:PAS domain S-box-containing protein
MTIVAVTGFLCLVAFSLGIWVDRRRYRPIQALSQTLETTLAELQLQKQETEAKNQALLEEQAKVRALFTSMTESVIIYDQLGKCQEVAAIGAPGAGFQELEKTNQQLSNRTVYEIFPHKLADFHLKTILEVLRTRNIKSVQYPLVVNAQKKWFSANISPLNQTLVLWVARDITQEKIVQQRYQDILETALDGIVSIDPQQQITLFNQGAERLFGYRAEEVLGQHIEILLPDRFRKMHRFYVRDFGEGQEATRKKGEGRKIRGKKKDGTEFWAEASISKVGEPPIFTVFMRPVED